MISQRLPIGLELSERVVQQKKETAPPAVRAGDAVNTAWFLFFGYAALFMPRG
jgi:hypothetical protein